MTKSLRPKLNTLVKKLKTIKAKDIMTEFVITTTEDTPLTDIAALMVKTRISGLPVIGPKGKIRGIITATDLFMMMDVMRSNEFNQQNINMQAKPSVKFAMSTEVIKVTKNTTLDKIIALMKCKNANTIPVVEGGKMVGVIGRHDALKSFYLTLKSAH